MAARHFYPAEPETRCWAQLQKATWLPSAPSNTQPSMCCDSAAMRFKGLFVNAAKSLMGRLQGLSGDSRKRPAASSSSHESAWNFPCFHRFRTRMHGSVELADVLSAKARWHFDSRSQP